MYYILDYEFKLSVAHLADQIFTVCAFPVNFQNLIFKELSLQGASTMFILLHVKLHVQKCFFA